MDQAIRNLHAFLDALRTDNVGIAYTMPMDGLTLGQAMEMVALFQKHNRHQISMSRAIDRLVRRVQNGAGFETPIFAEVE